MVTAIDIFVRDWQRPIIAGVGIFIVLIYLYNLYFGGSKR